MSNPFLDFFLLWVFCCFILKSSRYNYSLDPPINGSRMHVHTPPVNQAIKCAFWSVFIHIVCFFLAAMQSSRKRGHVLCVCLPIICLFDSFPFYPNITLATPQSFLVLCFCLVCSAAVAFPLFQYTPKKDQDGRIFIPQNQWRKGRIQNTFTFSLFPPTSSCCSSHSNAISVEPATVVDSLWTTRLTCVVSTHARTHIQKESK